MIVLAEQIALGPFLIDLAANRLLRDGAEVQLRPQGFHVLKALVQNSGRPVDYPQMIREAWHGVSVSKHTVAVTVGEVKRVLAECGAWIVYRPNLGYSLETPKSEELVRKAWHFWSRQTREGLEKALTCFEQAATHDGSDFRVFQGISLCYLSLGMHLMREPREMCARFMTAHRRAVELGGALPELRVDRAVALHLFERKLDEAEAELLSLRLERPNCARIYVHLAMVYSSLGRFEDALDVLVRAQAADSLLPSLPCMETAVRFFSRDFSGAIACGKKAIELHPYLQSGRIFYALALEYSSQMDEALAQYRLTCNLSPDLPWLRAQEASCLAGNGRRKEACAILDELTQLRATEYVDAYHMALLQAALGNRNEAFRELERACEENSAALCMMDMDPKMDLLRGDARFVRLRNGLCPQAAQAS